MSNMIDGRVKKLINEIIYSIKDNNIDVFELCCRLCINADEFINYLNNPRKNISLYLQILDEIQALNEVSYE